MKKSSTNLPSLTKEVSKEAYDVALKRLRLKQEKEEYEKSLPHLYKYKDYSWSKEFLNSRNRLCFLTAANQIGKSSVQIRKMIHWATSPELWGELWPEFVRDGGTPNQYWYLYPSKDVSTTEFLEKWMEFLPQGRMKDDPKYGWQRKMMNKHIWCIQFHSGATIYFKTYAQDVHKLQSGTCAYVGFDEELPMHLYDELGFRISATNGYMSGVFTATMGQDFWREVIEDKTRLTEADIWQVSLYDCKEYADGSTTKWTEEVIENRKQRCKSEAEVLRRIYGRFVKDEGLKYPMFSTAKHMVNATEVPVDWSRYVGIDIGSGGKSGHPSAITFIAVNPSHTFGYVYMHWRGDGIVTTSEDVLKKYLAMRGKQNITCAYYDWGNKDFHTFAERAGVPVTKAEKSHEIGEDIVGSLLKNEMVQFFHDDQTERMKNEFLTLSSDTPKRKAKDDSVDSFRYAVTLIPWDWAATVGTKKKKKVIKELTQEDLRRGRRYEEDEDKVEFDSDIEFWGSYVEGEGFY